MTRPVVLCYHCSMSKNEDRHFYSVLSRAYLLDGHTTHNGEALLLAVLLHAKGKSRDSEDFKDVQRIMRDKNLDK